MWGIGLSSCGGNRRRNVRCVDRGDFVHSNHIQKSEGNRKAKKRGSKSA